MSSTQRTVLYRPQSVSCLLWHFGCVQVNTTFHMRYGIQRKKGHANKGSTEVAVSRRGRLCRVPPELQDVTQHWLPLGVHDEHRSRHPRLVMHGQGFGSRSWHQNLRCTTCNILYNTITKLTPISTTLDKSY